MRMLGLTRPFFLLDGTPLHRASGLRHFAILVAVFAAWAMRRQLLLTDRVLWIFGLAAAGNLAIMFLSDRFGWVSVGRWLSSIFGIVGWAVLVRLTGWIGSPFIAGLWLEIVFSAVVLPPSGTLLATVAATASLWLTLPPDASAGVQDQRLWLQTGFIVATGALTFFASKRWALDQRAMSARANALGARLVALESELDEARKLGTVAEGVARFAHGLKGAVHSLRGFTGLLEGRSGDRDLNHQALQGLRIAIDRLEEIARSTLRPPGAEPSCDWTSAAEIDRTVADVVEEVGRRHHGVRWVRIRAEGLSGVALSRTLLREILLVLVENAAEASDSTGEVVVNLNREQGMFKLTVRDQGPGIAADLGERIFRVGATTKANGHGYGLFLARRLVESRGGRLIAAPGSGGGALFSVTLPLEGN